ncbi:MAG: hypothetical protein ACK5YO_27090, partial [Planctomyces sp.]
MLKHFQQNFVAGNVGFVLSQGLPFTTAVGAVGMVFEEQIPQMFVTLTVEAFTDDMHAAAQGDVGNFVAGKLCCPLIEPRSGRLGIPEGMEKCAHQMGFSLPAFALERYRASLTGASGFECFQKVCGGVSDPQKIGSGDLCGPGIVIVYQFNRRALQAASFELI